MIEYNDINAKELAGKLTGNVSRGRVLIKRCEMSKYGDIVMPGSSREKEMDYGIAIQISDVDFTNEYSYLNLSVGDQVYFGKYAGTNLKLKGELFYLLNEDDILYTEKLEG